MEEILHQLRLVVYPIIYRVLDIPCGCLGFLNHQQYLKRHTLPETIIAPKNGWLAYYSFPLGAHLPIFGGKLAVSFREGSPPTIKHQPTNQPTQPTNHPTNRCCSPNQPLLKNWPWRYTDLGIYFALLCHLCHLRWSSSAGCRRVLLVVN